ncbi:MAG: hypothetical protein V8R23_05750 [Alphaproteobacteria bacterium]|jgi:hypothetical protein
MTKEKQKKKAEQIEDINYYISEYSQFFYDTPYNCQNTPSEKPFYEQNNNFYYSTQTISCEFA